MYINEKYYCDRCLQEIDPEEPCPHCGFDLDAYEEAVHTLPHGTLLKQKYVIGSVIGEGGFGITYAGWDLALNKPIAIKEFYPKENVSRNSDESFLVTPNGTEENHLIYFNGVEWFQREARILAALGDTHNVVHVEDFFQANGTAYIIMDFIRGKTLAAYAAEKGGKIPEEEVLKLIKKPIEALQKVHRFGLLHGDISPANLMLDEHGEVHLIDFGASISLNTDSELNAQELFLNREFAPPEQLNRQAQGTWSDIYSVCATMVYLITGNTIPAPNERKTYDPIPKFLRRLKLSSRQRKAIQHGLTLNPNRRTENTAFFLNELYGIPLPKSEEERTKQKKFIRRVTLSIAVSYVLLYVVLALRINQQFTLAVDAWLFGNCESAFLLAEGYADGYFPGGEPAANYWFHYAATSGTDEQKYNVAEIYLKNQYADLPEDPDYALHILAQCHENGYADANNRLALLLWEGQTVQKDLNKAIQYLQEGIQDGNAQSMGILGLIYITEFNDYASAVPLLSSAAELGDPQAMRNLAMMYINGDGVKEDHKQAISLMLKAAGKALPDALAWVGMYYLSNDLFTDEGIEWNDTNSGLFWLQLAEDLESPLAFYYCGLVCKGEFDVSDTYLTGDHFSPSPQKAFDYMLKAAEGGIADAMMEVSEMYASGYGTSVDTAQATAWKNKAALP